MSTVLSEVEWKHVRSNVRRYETIISIFSQQQQENVRRSLKHHKKKHNIDKYLSRYNKGTSLAKIASTTGLPGTMLVRVLLPFLVEKEDKGDGSRGPGLSKKVVSSYIRDTSLLPGPRLREEVRECISLDFVYSPMIDRIKRSIGLEFEFILERKLMAAGVKYKTEDDLRKEGYSKTPDAFFSVPLIVKNFDSTGKEQVITWMDSKATFADRYLLRNNVQSQFNSYRHRFGPGMVIYWMGYVEELAAPLRAKGIIVCDRFPEIRPCLKEEEEDESVV